MKEQFRAQFGELVTAEFTHYHNGNRCIQLWTVPSPGGWPEPWATATVNFEEPDLADSIFVKDWSENEGMVEILEAAGIIDSEPIHCRITGYVQACAYTLTREALAKFQEIENEKD